VWNSIKKPVDESATAHPKEDMQVKTMKQEAPML
jgi:hypothetical protein